MQLRTRFAASLTAAAAAFTTSGCVSTASYHTAEPLEPGATETGFAAEVDTQIGGEDTETYLTHPRGYWRRGLTQTADLGVTAGAFGTGVDVNFAIAETDATSLSINPTQTLALTRSFGSTNGFIETDTDFVSTSLIGLLADLRLAEDVTLTGGFKPGVAIFNSDGEGGTEVEPFVAGSLGMRLGLSGGAHIFPEINLVAPVNSDSWEGDALVKFGIGVGF